MTAPGRWITRVERLADRTAIRQVVLAAFDTAEEADVVDALREDPAWIDGLSVVATPTTTRGSASSARRCTAFR
ncbi:hypothetical protein [Kribbia dieselivorans]|uniref:hypothetical protein n=1 Tax=Kribbia dieselivorans TaxID=331526 RepID=UPI001FDFAAE8|nr:hypothetical protein [Kribbia dieselivorans]